MHESQQLFVLVEGAASLLRSIIPRAVIGWEDRGKNCVMAKSEGRRRRVWLPARCPTLFSSRPLGEIIEISADD